MRAFDYSKVKDPRYFQENRLPAHSDHVYYATVEDLERGHNTFRSSLNGLWKFFYAPNYVSAIKDFASVELDCHGWQDIRVPAHIQMEGYDIPQYANVQYPWDGREEIKQGQIPEHFNPVAHYVKYFNVPETMQGKSVYISFQGVESAIALWCNGAFIGYSEDTFTPSEFELTPYLTEGENKLAVQVFKWSSSSWCEDQDFFRFSGIFRDVYLYTVPQVHVRDLKINTNLNKSFDEAELLVDFDMTASGQVQAQLLRNGLAVAQAEQKLSEHSLLTMTVQKPELWSAEEPNLYQLLLTISDETGTVTEVIEHKVGFRKFEIVDSIMMLNGKRIVFKGVNRHEFSSLSGRVVSEEELRKDLLTMKQHNINAIRTCHYPNASLIYSLCDELGLYMIDECNLESHGSWTAYNAGLCTIDEVVPGDREDWHDMMMDRANSMYQRDKNHPAILIWSCGNEAFGGKNIFDMSQFFREQDQTRLVHYEGIFHDRRYPDTSDIESQMYTPAAEIAQYLQKDRSKPFICCEYTHAMGNSCGGMHKYTELTETEPLYQGGFIWDYIDQSITKKDRYGQEFQAYGGDFGDRPCDYNFSGNGIAYGGNREASPKMQEVKYNYQNISIEVLENKARIKNNNLFVNTSQYECIVILEKEGKHLLQNAIETAIDPGAIQEVSFPFTVPDEAGEYTVTVSFRLKQDTNWAKAGHEVAFGQGVFRRDIAEAHVFADRPIAEAKNMKIIHGDQNLGVRGLEFEALFSYNYGGLVSYRYGGKELLKTIPKPNFWRAPVDNDCGNDMMSRYGQWKLASMYITHHGAQQPNPVVKEENGTVTVTYLYHMPTTPVSTCLLRYQVYGDGTIAITLTYDPVKELHDMPEFGVLFKIDADYDQVEWYGNGPQETYSDRKQGAKLGIYRNKVADNMAKYMVPQECGNKTRVRYAKVTDSLGRGLLFAGNEMYFSALPYTPHEIENAAHPNELPRVHYTVIRAALGQMGIGGDDSWGALPLPEYLLNADNKMEFTFYFKGI